MRRAPVFIGLASALALGGCVVAPPPGPSVMATPGQGKDIQAFQQDDGFCRQVASQQSGGMSPTQAANNSAVGSAVAGTAVGAAAVRRLAPRPAADQARVSGRRSVPPPACWSAAPPASAPRKPRAPGCNSVMTWSTPSAWRRRATTCRARRPVMPGLRCAALWLRATAATPMCRRDPTRTHTATAPPISARGSRSAWVAAGAGAAVGAAAGAALAPPHARDRSCRPGSSGPPVQTGRRPDRRRPGQS